MSATPGPWEWDEGRTVLRCAAHTSEAVLAIDLPEFMDEADKNLVAAAQDLLAALKLILQSHDETCKGEECLLSGIDLARAAIAKAETP